MSVGTQKKYPRGKLATDYPPRSSLIVVQGGQKNLPMKVRKVSPTTGRAIGAVLEIDPENFDEETMVAVEENSEPTPKVEQQIPERIKVTRLSPMANSRGSYAYAVSEKDSKTLVANDVSGLYDGQGSGKLIYSPARIGTLGQETTVPIVVRELRDGRKFVNLQSPKADIAGEFGELAQLAERAGFGGERSKAVVMQRFVEEVRPSKARVAQPEPEE